MHLQPRVNRRVVVVLSIIAVPIVFAAVAVALRLGQADIRAKFGEFLTANAEQTARAVDTFMFRRVMDAWKIARMPMVREAASAGSRRGFDAKAEPLLDDLWRAQPTIPPALVEVLNGPPAMFLADLVQSDPAWREVLLTDRHGRLVAASGRSTDYYQADELWWSDAFGDGVRGHLHVSDTEWDESARVDAFAIDVPVLDRSGLEVAGVLKVVVDVRELGALVGADRAGRAEGAALLREDGSHVLGSSGPGARPSFFGGEEIRKGLAANGAGGSLAGFIVQARGKDGEPYVIGVARTQLHSSYAPLRWVVATYEAESELFAPVRALATYVAGALMFVALMVLGLVLWCSRTLDTSGIQDELHLVEHPQRSASDQASAGRLSRSA